MAGILLQGTDVTDKQRAEHARALAAKERAAAIQRAIEAKARVGESKMEQALAIEGKVLASHIVRAGQPFSLRLAAGGHLRIIDLDGRQAVDLLCFDARNPDNRYNAANTLKLNRTIYLGKGAQLYGDLGDSLMTIVDDTVGFHDTIGGCCSTEMNHLRYGIAGTPSCRNNFIVALRDLGLSSRDLTANLNFFMYVPVAPDGSTEIVEGRSEPGDYVDLRAEKDVLIAISNCPQLYNPCNGWNPTPIRLIEWRPV